MQKVQLGILEQVAPKLKVGGLLVYSTCTIANEENKDTVDKFLSLHTDFEQVSVKVEDSLTRCIKNGSLQLYPHDFGTDGFFISCLRKVQK